MSSSAALECATVFALILLFDINIKDKKRRKKHVKDLKKKYKK